MRVRTHAVAKAAFACVTRRREGIDGARGVNARKYGALAHRLPGMLLENGLAQTTGFLLAKAKARPEHHALLDDLQAVLRAAEATSAADGPGLHREVLDADLARTMILTRRYLEAGGWLKRYSQGVLGVDATGERTTGTEPSVGDE